MCPDPARPLLDEINSLLLEFSTPFSQALHMSLASILNQCEKLFEKVYHVWPEFDINTFHIANSPDTRTFLNKVFFRQQTSLLLDNTHCADWVKMMIRSNQGIDLNVPILQLMSPPFGVTNIDYCQGKESVWKYVRPLETVMVSESVLSQSERQQVFTIILNHTSTNVNLATSTDFSILYMAMKHPPYYVEQLLTHKSTQVNGRPGTPSTPLVFALDYILHLHATSPWFADLAHFPLKNIMLLLAHPECNVSRKNIHTGFSAILLAAMTYGTCQPIFDRILEIDPNEIHAVANDGTNLFFIAVLRDDTTLLNKISHLYTDMKLKRVMTTALCLDSFPGPNLSKNLARTTEFLAGFCPQGPTLNDTLQKALGAKDFYRDYVGATVVHIAITRNNPPLLDILLNTDGLNVDLSITYLGQTALELATTLNRSNCITLLSKKLLCRAS